MCIPMKWQNEVSRFLKVDIQVQEKIILHKYFTVNLKIKNISLVKNGLRFRNIRYFY